MRNESFSSEEYVLQTEQLCKDYKGFKALDQVSMHVPKGSIYGFVGRNGAGKTTLMRIVSGLQEPTDGSYRILGICNQEKDIAQVRKHIGAVIETPAVYLEMTAEDNMKQQCFILGISDMDKINRTLTFVGLNRTGSKKVKDFSLGMKQRLGIALAIVGNPELLILDEPTNGLDPQGIIEMRSLILKLNKDYGITVLISSHILDELARLATHYGFIDNGRLIKEVSAAEIDAESRVGENLETYFMNLVGGHDHD